MPTSTESNSSEGEHYLLVEREEEEEEFVHRDSIKDSNLLLLQEGICCDASFTAGPSQTEIPCHKLFLLARSPVLKRIFSSRGELNSNSRIVLEDTDPETVKLFLKFIYADEFPTSFSQVLKLVHLAHKYEVVPLKKKCQELMSHELRLSNAIETFQAARSCDLEALMQQAGSLMARQFRELTNLTNFGGIDEETLQFLIQRDDLCLDESDIFAIVLSWANMKKRDVPERNLSYADILKSFIPLIRFPLMNAQDFTMNVVPTQILSQNDIIDLFVYFNGNSKAREEVSKKIPYSQVPRGPTLKPQTRKRSVEVQVATPAAKDLKEEKSGSGQKPRSEPKEEAKPVPIDIGDKMTVKLEKAKLGETSQGPVKVEESVQQSASRKDEKQQQKNKKKDDGMFQRLTKFNPMVDSSGEESD